MSNNTENNPSGIPAAIQIFHPLSGIVILLTDYLFFAAEIFPLTMPLACLLSFAISFTLVFFIQRHKAGNRLSASFLKALVGAAVTAIPTPVSGTIVGTAILALSGLRRDITPQPPRH